MKKTIRFKLLGIFTLLFLILASNSMWSIMNFNRLSDSIENIMESNYRSIVAAQNMIVALERQDSSELAYMFSKDEETEKIFLENEETFFKWLSRAEDNITENGEEKVLNEVSKLYTEYIKKFNILTKLQPSDNIDESKEYYYKEILPLFEEVKESCRKLQNLNQNAMLTRRDNAHDISKNATYSTIMVSSITIFIGILLVVYLTSKITKPIYNLIEKIKKISERDYSQQLDIVSNDEIGELAGEFNIMTEKLKSYELLNIKKVMKEKQKAEAIVESISDGIVVTDEHNTLILVNRSAEKSLGIREKDVLNKHFLEVIKREDIFDMIDKVKNSNDIEDYRGYIDITVDIDENVKHYRINTRPIRDRDNDNVGVVTLMQDITKLKEIDQIKSDFVSTVSHEFRTPLTSIGMAVGLLIEKTSGDINANQEELLLAIKEDNERLKNLVSDLLDLSRLESGKMLMDIDSYDINEIVEYAVKPFYSRASEKNILLEIETGYELPNVEADFNKISWVITNLIGNAITYTPEDGNGKINIKTRLTGNKIIVSVSDNGKGIAEDYHEKIFNKFIQVRGEGNEDKGGTGLGLAISKEIINAHRGEIWVNSKLNEGSTFYFTLYASKKGI